MSKHLRATLFLERTLIITTILATGLILRELVISTAEAFPENTLRSHNSPILLILTGGPVDIQKESFYEHIEKLEKQIQENTPHAVVQTRHISQWKSACRWIEEHTKGLIKNANWVLLESENSLDQMENFQSCVEHRKVPPNKVFQFSTEDSTKHAKLVKDVLKELKK